jgi:DNA-directed RNA polymerase subunit RPC12/RpoP
MPTTPGASDATIVYTCPSCRRTHSVQSRLVGRRARCHNCGHVGRIIEAGAPGSEQSVYELAGPPVPAPPPPPPPVGRSPRAPQKGVLAKAWTGGAIEESQIQGLAVLLIVLSAADLLMTVTLLRASPRFIEGNPVANWFLARWNILGLVMFKFGILSGVTVLSEFIERRRPGWGRLVLFIGCAGAAYAVYTGLKLYTAHVAVPVAVVE